MSSNPDSVRARFGIRFSIVARRWRQELEAALAREGLTDATWAPMIHLDESGGGLLQKELAERVGIDDSTLVRLLDILEQKGWTERRTDPSDARARRVYLTHAGQRQVQHIRSILLRTETSLLDSLGDAEIISALEAIDRLDARLIAARLARKEAEQ